MNHRASDPICPGRKAYTDSRNRTVHHHNTKEKPTQSNRNQLNKNLFIDAPIPAPLTNTFSSIVSNTQIPIDNGVGADTDNVINSDNQSGSLFSTAELLRIFTNAIGQIKNCRPDPSHSQPHQSCNLNDQIN